MPVEAPLTPPALVYSTASMGVSVCYADDVHRYYTSPKSYMDLISLYTSLLAEKRAEYGEVEDRLNNGLNKLRETNAVVDVMQAQLNQLQPILEEKAQACCHPYGSLLGCA